MAYCAYSRNTINVTGFNYNFTSLAKLRNCFLGKYLFLYQYAIYDPDINNALTSRKALAGVEKCKIS